MSDKPTWVGLFGSDPDMGKGHEPECESPSPAGHCIECDQLRAAYQRGREDADRWCNVADIAYRKGREDAAKAVEVALSDYVYGEDFGPPEFRIVAAARGDANCAHSRTQYTREVCWCGDAVDVCDDCGVDVHECADGADAGNRNASVPEDATLHAALTTLDDRK